MSEDKTVIAYRLEPIYKEDMGGMRTNCSEMCRVSRVTLWGQGIGGDCISPIVRDLLMTNKPLKELIRQEVLNHDTRRTR